VSLDDDRETVTIPIIPSRLLNGHQRQVLAELTHLSDEAFGIHSYILARMYIFSIQQSNLSSD